MATSATYNGITWTWTEDRTTGTYVNGDPYVIIGAGLTLTGTTPAMATGRNGIEVNPTQFTNQGWDDRTSNYDASLRPTLPYSTSAGDSVIKTRSMTTADQSGYIAGQPVNQAPADTYGDPTRTDIREAGILTVVSAAPASTAFRPSPFDPTTTTHLISEIDQTRIPNGAGSALPAIDPGTIDLDGRTLAILERRFARYQLDIQPLAAGRGTRPYFQMNNYDGFVARDIYEAILMLQLDYTYAAKEDLLHGMIQYGLDLYYEHKNTSVEMHGGRKMAMIFAAYMIDNATMLADIKVWGRERRFYDDLRWNWTPESGLHLWGELGLSEDDYWTKIVDGTGNGSTADPQGRVDGGFDPVAASYDQIHGSPKMAAYSLICRELLPDLEEFWHTDSLAAGDRTGFYGGWTLPDEYELVTVVADGGTQDGVGRWPTRDGNAIFGSGSAAYKSDFAQSISDTVRTTQPMLPPSITPYNPASVVQGSQEVTLAAFDRITPAGYPSYWAQYPSHPSPGSYPYIVPDQIRYTTDGTDPTASSTLYSGAFTVTDADAVDGVVEVRARSFNSSFDPSGVMVSRIGVVSDASIPVQTASQTSGSSGVASVTATFGATPTENNLLVATIAARFTGASNGVQMQSAGWTLFEQNYSPSGAPSTAVYYKTAGASESTTVTGETTTGTRRMAIVVAEYPIANPVLAASASDTSGQVVSEITALSTGTTASVTQPKVAIALWAGQTDSSLSTGGLTYTNSFVERDAIGDDTAGRAVGVIASKAITADGTVSETATATTANSWSGVGHMLVFNSPDSTPPTVEGATINAAGNEIAITFSEAMNNSNTTGFSLSGSGNNNQTYTLSTPVWSVGDTVLTFAIGTGTVQADGQAEGESVNSIQLSYTAGNVRDVAGNSLADFSNRTSGITNGSTQGLETVTAQIQTDGTVRVSSSRLAGLWGSTVTVKTSAVNSLSQDGVSRSISSAATPVGGGSTTQTILTVAPPIYSPSNGAVEIDLAQGFFTDNNGVQTDALDDNAVSNSSTQEPSEGGGPSTKGNSGISISNRIGL